MEACTQGEGILARLEAPGRVPGAFDPVARDAIAEHLLALDGDDRHMRFDAVTTDDFIRRYVAGINLVRDIVIAFSGDPEAEGPELVALAHVGLDGDQGEVGLSVLREHRGRGLGRTLVAEALRRAFLRGADRLIFHIRHDNGPMLRVVRSFNARIERGPEGIVATLDSRI